MERTTKAWPKRVMTGSSPGSFWCRCFCLLFSYDAAHNLHLCCIFTLGFYHKMCTKKKKNKFALGGCCRTDDWIVERMRARVQTSDTKLSTSFFSHFNRRIYTHKCCFLSKYFLVLVFFSKLHRIPWKRRVLLDFSKSEIVFCSARSYSLCSTC